MSTFRRAVEDAGYEPVKSELKWLAHACDTARNLDVFAAETLAPAAQMAPPPTSLEDLSGAVERARARANAQVAEVVASARFRGLLIEATGWVDTGAWLQGEAADGSARRFASKVLRKRFAGLVRDGHHLRAGPDEARHQVRIDAKKLRYAAEGFQGLYTRKDAKRFIDQLKTLQDELGALNDLATAEAMLPGLELDAPAAFAFGELVGLKAADKDRHIAAAAKALRRLAHIEPFWG